MTLTLDLNLWAPEQARHSRLLQRDIQDSPTHKRAYVGLIHNGTRTPRHYTKQEVQNEEAKSLSKQSCRVALKNKWASKITCMETLSQLGMPKLENETAQGSSKTKGPQRQTIPPGKQKRLRTLKTSNPWIESSKYLLDIGVMALT